MASADKALLRKEFLVKRNALDETERERNSSLIRQRLFTHPVWKNSSIVLCYVSFGSEVGTHALIQEGLRFKKRVIIPIHDPAKHDTPISEISRFGELTQSHRGILQVDPQFQRLVDPGIVELALIPGIVFDKKGTRIGFGGGYFDKLLPHLTKATRMALAFEAQFSSKPLPVEPHDMSMEEIVTEKAIYKMANKS
jgi:5-formyltetrahydrofolate cyclo-ligase